MDFWLAVVLIVLITTIGRVLGGRHHDGGGSSARVTQLEAEVKRLQTELTELRETTTRYDVSFDSALQRLERRLADAEAARSQARTDQVSAGL